MDTTLGPYDVRSFLPSLSSSDVKRINEEVLPLIRPPVKGEDARVRLARQVIENLVVKPHSDRIVPVDKLLFSFACAFSNMHLPGYATLDEQHIKSITNLVAAIKVYANDTSQKRPLVFLMLASPGAGKSHFIKCIAMQLTSLKVGAITYNMAGLRTGEDMIPPLDAARNLKVEDRIPLLFLDEFDSSPGHVPMLLPLLWDGDVTIGQRDLKLGKVVIVLAGSDPSLPATMEDARSMREEARAAQGNSPKMIDLLSRINGGVFSIPPFYDAGQALDRRADKVCIIVHLLRQRFGSDLREAPLCLLRFAARAEFRYGVRSIAHLVSMIPYRADIKTLRTNDLVLPLESAAKLKNSSLAYHLLHQDQAYGVEKLWKECLGGDCQIPVRSDDFALIPLMPRYRDDRYFTFMIANMLRSLLPEHEQRRTNAAKKASNKRLNRTVAPRRRGATPG